MLEYFFGKIQEEYTTTVIDSIQNKTNLGILLDTKLWHSYIETLKDYVELKYIITNDYNGNKSINENLDIKNQIEGMKKIIDEEDFKSEHSKNLNENKLVIKTQDNIDSKIDKEYKKYRVIKIDKKIRTKELKKESGKGNHNPIKIFQQVDPNFIKRIYRK